MRTVELIRNAKWVGWAQSEHTRVHEFKQIKIKVSDNGLSATNLICIRGRITRVTLLPSYIECTLTCTAVIVKKLYSKFCFYIENLAFQWISTKNLNRNKIFNISEAIPNKSTALYNKAGNELNSYNLAGFRKFR